MSLSVEAGAPLDQGPAGVAGRVADYLSVRSQMQTGDILAFSGEHWQSRVIRYSTKSPYSHLAFIYVEADGRRSCWEAVGSGVRRTYVSTHVKHYEGHLDYFRVINPDATAEKRAAALAFIEKHENSHYDLGGLAKFLFFLLTGKRLKNNRGEFFCSELVAAAYEHVKLDLYEPEPAAYTAPADLTDPHRSHVEGPYCIRRPQRRRYALPHHHPIG